MWSLKLSIDFVSIVVITIRVNQKCLAIIKVWIVWVRNKCDERESDHCPFIFYCTWCNFSFTKNFFLFFKSEFTMKIWPLSDHDFFIIAGSFYSFLIKRYGSIKKEHQSVGNFIFLPAILFNLSDLVAIRNFFWGEHRHFSISSIYFIIKRRSECKHSICKIEVT